MKPPERSSKGLQRGSNATHSFERFVTAQCQRRAQANRNRSAGNNKNVLLQTAFEEPLPNVSSNAIEHAEEPTPSDVADRLAKGIGQLPQPIQ